MATIGKRPASTQAQIAAKIGLYKAIGELGVKNIARAISSRLGREVGVSNLNAGMLRVSTLAEATGDPDNAAVGVCTRVEGECPGEALFLLPYQQALSLVDAVMGSPVGTRKRFDELSTSALQEVARTIVLGQLVAFSDICGTDFKGQSITMAIDMAYRIVSSVTEKTGDTDSEAMVVAVRFKQPEWHLDTTFIFIPQAGSSEKMLEASSRWGQLR